MTKLLDTVDASLQEVEEQLLDEFTRIRNKLSDSPFEPIDMGIQNSLGSVINELWHMLENSGDKKDLQLQTRRHETLFARVSVIRQLLGTKIPTAFLHEVHKDVKSSRRNLEHKVEANRAIQSTSDADKATIEKTPHKKGFFGSIKQIFSSNKSTQETLRNRIKITEQEAKQFEKVEMYLDNGIYSASRELAMLSNRMHDSDRLLHDHEEPEKKPASRVTGKASFESRDISHRLKDQKQAPTSKSIAQTPEEIRRKLATTQTKSNTVSIFESKELTQTIAPAQNIKAVETLQQQNRDIAQSPEAIRKKLAARQNKGTSGKASFGATDIEPIPQPKVKLSEPQTTENQGKATFGAKDVEHQMPQPKFIKKDATYQSKTTEVPEPPPTGKAIFESKDLSKPGPIPKR